MNILESLLLLMSLPPAKFADVTRTSDGLYFAREHGDCGYNAFLGRPAKPRTTGAAADLRSQTLAKLTVVDRRAVVRMASVRDITPENLREDFGVDFEEVGEAHGSDQ